MGQSHSRLWFTSTRLDSLRLRKSLRSNLHNYSTNLSASACGISFSNSWIIHLEKTKEITPVIEFGYVILIIIIFGELLLWISLELLILWEAIHSKKSFVRYPNTSRLVEKMPKLYHSPKVSAGSLEQMISALYTTHIMTYSQLAWWLNRWSTAPASQRSRFEASLAAPWTALERRW